MEERLSATGGELLAHIRGGVATVTLNRPAALNALSFAMLEGLARWLDEWEHDERVRIVVLQGAGEKAFCAGGDIRALYASATNGGGDAGYMRFFELEYALDQRIHEYPKPIVANLDGIVMGGGMGLAQGASLRIVGDRTRMAMPETGIGLFPDVGGSYFLSRLPGKLGAYIGMAGPTLRATDAIYSGLADVYCSAEDLARLPETLAAGDSPEGRALPAGELEMQRDAIDHHFAADSVEAIVASLHAEADPVHAEWAARTAEVLSKRSPTMLKVTLEQLARGASMSLADCFRMELGLVRGCFEQGDVIEGIRALLIEKDNRPRWNPAELEQVDRDRVESFFA